MHAAGKHVPAIERRPRLTGWGWLWDAFWSLNTCRPIGMSAGPIPWTAVQRYAEVERLSRDEADMLHQVVAHLDQELLAYHRAKSERTSSARTVTKGGPRGATGR